MNILKTQGSGALKPEREIIRIAATLAPEAAKLRVASYSRVSTDFEEQLASFHAQKAYYTDLIIRTPEWTLAGTYADEGLSGESAEKRPDFMKMIRHGKKGADGQPEIIPEEAEVIHRIYTSYLTGMSIEGIASRTLKDYGLAEQAREMRERIMNGADYNEALCIIGEYVNITSMEDAQEWGGMEMGRSC